MGPVAARPGAGLRIWARPWTGRRGARAGSAGRRELLGGAGHPEAGFGATGGLAGLLVLVAEAEGGFGPLAGGVRWLLVDVLGLLGHVGQDRDPVVGDLDEAAVDGEADIVALLGPDHGRADVEGTDERGVAGEERDVAAFERADRHHHR